MLPTRNGSIRLFQFAGVTVYLHWLWFVIAAYEMSGPANRYDSRLWNALEYLGLFGIVLLHEFGHALACRSVGGRAEQIVLWPLGGVAYVQPPSRPGATLWSIAAGPLVNVVLFGAISAVAIVGPSLNAWIPGSNVGKWVTTLWMINLVLLLFNMLPIYPLDGGQILSSLLWYFLGRARSLMIATSIGLAGVLGLILLAVAVREVWLGILAAFILVNCWRGFQAARAMIQFDRLPRRDEVSCPSCRQPPPIGLFWHCATCGTQFDAFATGAVCPQCATRNETTKCIQCGSLGPLFAWRSPKADARSA